MIFNNDDAFDSVKTTALNFRSLELFDSRPGSLITVLLP